MKTFLDWSAYENAGLGDAYADIPKTGGDFAKAVAVCIGSRQCETHGKGVMCPSFRISEQADFSTGGRVRLLKAALNGELGQTPWTDPALAATMAACVGCKGCKRECESAVDMALLKVEYLAQCHAVSGVPRRNWLFAHLPLWLHERPWLKSLIVWRNRLPWLAQLGERLFGISARRRLPEPATIPFTFAPQPDNGREVVLLVDSFSRYFEPAIAQAALTVLNAAGYRVHIAQAPAGERPLCCGRSLFAHGLVTEARAEAVRLLAAVLPQVAAGRTVIGLEPACLLMLRDDYKALGLGAAAEQVAAQALLFEEFIAREQAAKRFDLPLKPLNTAAPLLVHGHCHQKAVGAMKSMRKVLKLIPGLQFELIEAACCGMAGSFGLEAEHAEQAQAMAEQALLPALRAAPAAPVLANGFACRQQIREGSGREPVHLAVLLQAALASLPAPADPNP